MKLNLSISGMSCEHCTSYVTQVLNEMTGISVIDIGLEGAIIETDSSVTEDEIKEAIDEAGYELTDVKSAQINWKNNCLP